MKHTCLCIPSRNRSSFADPRVMEGWAMWQLDRGCYSSFTPVYKIVRSCMIMVYRWLPLAGADENAPYDCWDIKLKFKNPDSGIHTVYVGKEGIPVKVYCSNWPDTGGWTVCSVLYTVYQKNSMSLHYCSNYKRRPISIIFGALCTEEIFDTTIIDVFTSFAHCCYTTLGNTNGFRTFWLIWFIKTLLKRKLVACVAERGGYCECLL